MPVESICLDESRAHSSVRLERIPDKDEVPGSSPGGPTHPQILTSIGRRKAADPPPRCRSAEVFFPVLAGLALLRRLGAPQLHSPDLSGDRLGEVVGELDAADHLV